MKTYKYTSNDDCILSVEEQKEIVDWVKINYLKLDSNGLKKYKKCMDEIDDIPKIVWEIKKRIMEKENLYGYEQEPSLRDSIGYMLDGGSLHTHTDPNKDGLVHTRFNVYVQIPYEGGIPIYAGYRINLKERTYTCCRSGLDSHYCEKVKGDRERVVLSFGFLLPYERVKNVIYEYDN